MNIPLIILYVLSFIGLLFASNRHGKPKEGDNSFWSDLLAMIIQWILIWWALGWRFI